MKEERISSKSQQFKKLDSMVELQESLLSENKMQEVDERLRNNSQISKASNTKNTSKNRIKFEYND
jgi:hypothetical protein